MIDAPYVCEAPRAGDGDSISCGSLRLRLVGIDAMAQVDLGSRQNQHQPLRDLSAMAYAVLVAASARVHGRETIEAFAPGTLALPTVDGVDVRQIALEERPALRALRMRDRA